MKTLGMSVEHTCYPSTQVAKAKPDSKEKTKTKKATKEINA